MKSSKLFLFTFIFCLVLSVNAQNLTVKEIMKEPSIAGMRVEGEQLSPDGKYVVYLWNAEGREPRDLYFVSTSGGDARKILSPQDLINKKNEEKEDKLNYGVVINDDFAKAQRNGLGNLAWSPDSTKILFAQNGDLYVLKIGENSPKRITKTESFEFSARFLDNDRILFQQSGNLFSINTKDGTLVQISKEANSAKNINVSNATPAKDGSMIAYIASEGAKQKPIFVPNYLGELTTAPSFQRGWTNQTIYAAATDGSFEKSIAAELPKAEGESYFQGLEWLADGKTLLVDRVDKTHKRRQIFVVQFNDEKSKAFLVHEETDEKWIGSPARILEANPQNANQFFFGSEKDGFYHLYLVNLDESKFKDGKANARINELTEGNWEVDWAKWLNNNTNEIIFSATKFGTKDREFFIQGKFDISPRVNIQLGGMKTDPQISQNIDENPTLLYSFSLWNYPTELFAQKVNFESNIPFRKLSQTTPESFLKRKFNEPKFIDISSRDNKQIPAKIYLPENFDKTKKYPMVIFVHGAGYLQNVINGWNNYYREFMFNELLTQKGYVVLDIDYRGSAGYGRDWRTDVYDFLGGKDYEDHLDAIDFMVANYAVDVKRIGAYGGSYGGFMATMLVMRAPDKIAAAAALRPVMDWKNYYAANPFYTSQRLRSPQENPEGYKRSSPITYAGNLQKRLLILHGLVDNNVQIQDSIQLVEQLIRLDKTEYFDLMIYPAENHAFQRPSSWEDEYERILELFEKNLK
jgi:dipeptidyl aminopeptidase/acylaminoacyl peptidase